MVDAELFNKLEQIARIVRVSTEPFGGIQVIVIGDFFQLFFYSFVTLILFY